MPPVSVADRLRGRLKQAGLAGQVRIAPEAYARIALRAGGSELMAERLFDAVLCAATAERLPRVSAEFVDEVARTPSLWTLPGGSPGRSAFAVLEELHSELNGGARAGRSAQRAPAPAPAVEAGGRSRLGGYAAVVALGLVSFVLVNPDPPLDALGRLVARVGLEGPKTTQAAEPPPEVPELAPAPQAEAGPVPEAAAEAPAPQTFPPVLAAAAGIGEAGRPLPLFVRIGHVGEVAPKETFLQVFGLPAGASLSRGTDMGGIWEVKAEELVDLAVLTEPEHAGDLELVVTAVADYGDRSETRSETVSLVILPPLEEPDETSIAQETEEVPGAADAPPEEALAEAPDPAPPEPVAEAPPVEVAEAPPVEVAEAPPEPVLETPPVAEAPPDETPVPPPAEVAEAQPAEPPPLAPPPARAPEAAPAEAPVEAPAVAAAPPPPAPPASARLPETLLMARGDEFLAQGDLASARLLYERAATQGSGRAAVALGKTYDPLLVRAIRGGIAPDAQKAADWYRQAIKAGDPEAERRLRDLDAWLARRGQRR